MKEYQYVPVEASGELDVPEEQILDEQMPEGEFVSEESDLKQFVQEIANKTQQILDGVKILLEQERESAGGKRQAGFRIGADVQCKDGVEDEIARIFGNAAQ